VKGIMNFVNWVDHLNQRCELEELSLEGNNIGDSLAIELISSLSRSQPPLKMLNLSRNNLGDQTAI